VLQLITALAAGPVRPDLQDLYCNQPLGLLKGWGLFHQPRKEFRGVTTAEKIVASV